MAAAANLPADLRTARNVLVCARWGIGDLVMELPLLKALRQHVPHAHITALAASPASELLEHESVFDRVVEVQQFGLRHWGDEGDEAVRRDITEWGRVSGFDCILDGSHAPRGAHLALSELNVGWYDTGPHLRAHRQADDGLNLLAAAAGAAWGITPDEATPRLELGADERHASARVLEGLDGQGPWLGMAPIASSPLKRGRAAEFARAADALIEKTGGRVLLFVALEGDESLQVRSLMNNAERAHVVEPLHLRVTAAVMEHCRVLICNDTGLMHLAAAVDVPVVAVFACTSPLLYLPPGGVAVPRWIEPCRYLEAQEGRFGVTPCVAAGGCLVPEHNRTERWADAAVEAASAVCAPT